MANPIELIDMRVDVWGRRYNTAGERLNQTERKVKLLENLAFPSFDPEPWNSSKIYQAMTFVHDDNGNSYVSLQEVPSGISIHNIEYWVSWEVKDAYLQFLKAEIELQKARMSLIIEAGVVEAITDLELYDARIDFQGKTYPTIGDAVRAQIKQTVGLKVSDEEPKEDYIKQWVNPEDEEEIEILESSDIDTTLSVRGKVAEAKAVGDMFKKFTKDNHLRVKDDNGLSYVLKVVNGKLEIEQILE